MKIVFVTQPLSMGGAERVVASLANRFVELGHKVKIVVVDNGDVNTYYTKPEIEFIHISKPSNPVFDLLYRAKKIRQFLDFYNPDVVLPFATQKNVSVLLATAFSRHKVIISERNNPYLDPKSKALRILRKLLYWTADGYVFQTDGARDYFSNSIQKRSCIIANPITSQLPPVWSGKREHRIVMVNRLDAQKNIKMAIDAFSEIYKDYTDYVLEIYGKGPMKSELEAYIDSKGVSNRILLMGYCSDVTERIRSAEIYLMTSDYEGMSNSLMEALGLGLVCVSTDHPTGGARALIENGVNGILFPVSDVAGCINSLREVLDSEKKRSYMSLNAIKIRNNLSIESIADQWIEFIKQYTYEPK